MNSVEHTPIHRGEEGLWAGHWALGKVRYSDKKHRNGCRFMRGASEVCSKLSLASSLSLSLSLSHTHTHIHTHTHTHSLTLRQDVVLTDFQSLSSTLSHTFHPLSSSIFFYLQTFSQFLIVNKTSLSLSSLCIA